MGAEILIFVLLGYLAGSIPFGLLIAKWAGKGDIRAQGSGNIGATNVARVGSKKLGLLVWALDSLKGVVPVYFASLKNIELAAFTSIAAVVGHMFPVWLKFKGGKGVATTLAVVTTIAWPVGIFAYITWMFVYYLRRISSLSSLSTMGMLIAVSVIDQISLGWPAANLVVPVCIIAISTLVILKHHQNIRRLVSGNEGTV